ncbi:MAG: Iturin A synthetase C [candidate division WS6 bacterium 34_10]|uniref:Iturin A synthetase C n=1 Tax=candidate division WS6 bacterium 34_10 TaxID=1641389 RepID=A0A101HFY5_9BACT|nr:MAG: Iturin A synthetase C [candidate division WS6 bacterium 34_10]
MRYLLHDVFTESALKYPNRIAVKMEDGVSTTYKELNSLSNKFAHFLLSKKKDIRKEPFLGVIAPVTTTSIAAVLGILKIGGTYVPLDEYSPYERLSQIIKNTGLETIVIDSYWLNKHKDLLDLEEIDNVIIIGDRNKDCTVHNNDFYSLEEIKACNSSEIPKLNQVSDDLAYILHSSGSTGVPKGIMLTHRNARTFVDWMQKEFKLTKNDIVMSRAPFKFDLSVFDIFNTLNAGAKLVCFDWTKKRLGDQKHKDYVSLMEREEATILYTTPSTYITFLNRGGLAEAKLNLREVMYAGEPFPTPQLKKLQKALGRTRIANIYGPTETNIITYYWIDSLPEDDSPIPLGDVVEDTEIIVVSEDGTHICKPNEQGELWCRGGTVTMGYLGQEEKTKECLVESPFHKYPAYFWRTGDFGYRDDSGCLHYIGRRDHMVKVKGFRIELGEVEAAIAPFQNIDEFAVIAIPDEKYGNRLYCYFTTLKNQSIKKTTLKTFIKKKLPEYMIPYKFIELETMPKTSSGKIDRISLANGYL